MNGAGGAAGPVTGAGPSSHNISHKTQHSGKMTKDFVICSLTSKGTQLSYPSYFCISMENWCLVWLVDISEYLSNWWISDCNWEFQSVLITRRRGKREVRTVCN